MRSIYPTLLSHTVEHYLRLPVMRESTINHSHAITENFSNDNEAASINCQHRSLPNEILCLVLSHKRGIFFKIHLRLLLILKGHRSKPQTASYLHNVRVNNPRAWYKPVPEFFNCESGRQIKSI